MDADSLFFSSCGSGTTRKLAFVAGACAWAKVVVSSPNAPRINCLKYIFLNYINRFVYRFMACAIAVVAEERVG